MTKFVLIPVFRLFLVQDPAQSVEMAARKSVD